MLIGLKEEYNYYLYGNGNTKLYAFDRKHNKTYIVIALNRNDPQTKQVVYCPINDIPKDVEEHNKSIIEKYSKSVFNPNRW